MGVDISVGKLMVYTGAAELISTVSTLVVDAGDNRESLPIIKLPQNRHEEVRGDRYYDFIDKGCNTAEKLFLSCICTGRTSGVQMPQIFSKS